MQPQERIILNQLKAVFPKGITPEIRAQIDASKSQGKTLEIGIARVICEESNIVRDSLMEMLKFPQLTPEQEKDEEILDQRFREGQSTLFSIMATQTFYQAASLRLLLAAGEPSPIPKAKESGFADTIIQNLEIDVATEKEVSLDEVEQMKATGVAEGFLLDEMIKSEFTKKNPLEFIDFCTEAEEKRVLDQMPGSKDNPMALVWKMALQQGRQRFHQLYEDMQKPIPDVIS